MFWHNKRPKYRDNIDLKLLLCQNISMTLNTY